MRRPATRGSGSAGTAGTSQCANAICAAGAPHTPAAAENSHHSRRLRSAGNNRLCLLAKSCRDPGGQPGIPCRAGSTAEQHPHGTNAADLAAGWLHRDMG